MKPARKTEQPTPVAAKKARAHLGELLEDVSRHSKRFLITKKEQPIGVLISLKEYFERFGEKKGKGSSSPTTKRSKSSKPSRTAKVIQSSTPAVASARIRGTQSIAMLLKDLDALPLEQGGPNWNGEGALPVSMEAPAIARRLCRLLPAGMPSPELGVDPDGEVCLEWWLEPRWTFSVSVGANGQLSYSGLFGEASGWGSEKLEGRLPAAVANGLSRFRSRAA